MNPTFYITLLTSLYGAERAAQTEKRLKNLIDHYHKRIRKPAESTLSEQDSILITYGDQVRSAELPHLRSLAKFCDKYLRGNINCIHILPFFPWSSDDGFSIKDYRMVDPALGNWNDIDMLGRSFRLMFDMVINHASVQGNWFKAFLRGESLIATIF